MLDWAATLCMELARDCRREEGGRMNIEKLRDKCQEISEHRALERASVMREVERLRTEAEINHCRATRLGDPFSDALAYAQERRADEMECRLSSEDAGERTCQIVVSIDRSPASYGGRVHRCSSCGKALPGALFRNGWTQLDYCPRCGARVTEVIRNAD